MGGHGLSVTMMLETAPKVCFTEYRLLRKIVEPSVGYSGIVTNDFSCQDQYDFCYKAVLEYLGSFDTYANFSL